MITVINIQSETDIITNSSSEIFQLNTDESVETIDEILSTFTDGYYPPFKFDLKDFREYINSEHTLEKPPYPDTTNATREEFDELWEKYEKQYNKWSREHLRDIIYDVVDGWFFDPKSEEKIFQVYEDYLRAYYLKKPLHRKFLKFIGSNRPQFYNNPLIKQFIEQYKDEFPSMEEMRADAFTYYGNVEDLDGKILLLSSSENSISYENFAKIKELFNGVNYHLG